MTTIVVVSLTLYTFWAAKRGHDFNFLGPFLFGALLVLMLFAFIQVFGSSNLCAWAVSSCTALPSCFLHLFWNVFFFNFRIGHYKSQNLYSFWSHFTFRKLKKRCTRSNLEVQETTVLYLICTILLGY